MMMNEINEGNNELDDTRRAVTIGVLGGIGPEATGVFYSRLIAALQRRTGIVRNKDFPRIVVNSIPAPELVDEEVTDEQLEPYLEGIRMLARERPDFVVMVCNSIHLFRDRLQQESQAPILSLPSAVERVVRARGARRVGVLGTAPLMRSDLYRFKGIEVVPTPDGLGEQLKDVVVRFNRGEDVASLRGEAEVVAQSLVAGGAELVVLACTELSLLLAQSGLPVLDTLDVLVDATVSEFLRQRQGGWG
jgi:aspartate racemase